MIKIALMLLALLMLIEGVIELSRPRMAKTAMMPAIGLGLLIFVGLGIVLTGLPAGVVLIVVASVGAVIGVAADQVPMALLAALPERVINLLESISSRRSRSMCSWAR